MSMDSVTAAETRLAAARAAHTSAPPDVQKPDVQKRDKASVTSENEGFQPFGSDGLTFADVLDVINPLQHIPVVSSIYRKLTGDEIDPASRVAGGTLFGGVIGAAVSVFNVILKEITGRDTGEHVLAFINGEDEAATNIAGGEKEPAEGEVKIAWNGPRQIAESAAAAPEVNEVNIAWNNPRAVPQGEASLARAAKRTGGADVFAAVRYGRNGGAQEASLQKAASLGATAREGGWFSVTMLNALARYEHGAELALPPKQAQVDFLN